MNETLKRAVIRQLGGKQQLKDVARHGAQNGFSGFIYYADTIAFYKRQRAAIVELLEERAKDFNCAPVQMVRDFYSLGRDCCSEREVYATLYGTRRMAGNAYMLIANALAWFALEEVARYVHPNL